MTVLIAWISLSAGIAMGAFWRSLCEGISRGTRTEADDYRNPNPLGLLDWQEYVTLRREHDEQSRPFSSSGQVNQIADGTSVIGAEPLMQQPR